MVASKVRRSRRSELPAPGYILAIRLDRYWENASVMDERQRSDHLKNTVALLVRESRGLVVHWYSRREGEFLGWVSEDDGSRIPDFFARLRSRFSEAEELTVPVTFSGSAYPVSRCEEPGLPADLVAQRASDAAVRRMIAVAAGGGNSVSLPVNGDAAQGGERGVVMVLDSDELHVMLARELLVLDGWTVIHLESGAEAVEEIRQRGPDVVLCDYSLPAKSPFEIREALRSNWSTASIPFILLARRRNGTVLKAAFDAGIAHVIGKPYPAEELRGLVRLLAQRSRDVS